MKVRRIIANVAATDLAAAKRFYGDVLGLGFVIEYGPVDELWGVRRFYVCDPFGRLVNILSHR